MCKGNENTEEYAGMCLIQDQKGEGFEKKMLKEKRSKKKEIVEALEINQKMNNIFFIGNSKFAYIIKL